MFYFQTAINTLLRKKSNKKETKKAIRLVNLRGTQSGAAISSFVRL